VKERGSCDVGDWRPDLLPGVNDIHSKGIDGIAADVVAVDSRDEDLALVVVDEQASNHFRPFSPTLHVFENEPVPNRNPKVVGFA
jgi:hypothetical protein